MQNMRLNGLKAYIFLVNFSLNRLSAQRCTPASYDKKQSIVGLYLKPFFYQ